jgi:hypothetical protein
MKNEQLLVIELIVIPQIHSEVSHSRQAKGFIQAGFLGNDQ